MRWEDVKLVYIAGPYRAQTAWRRQRHIRAARELSLDVCKLGAFALCPHANTADFDGELPDAFWLEGDLAQLFRCDALITVDGWERSAGARAEVAFAREHGLPVFLTLEDLAFWLNAADREGLTAAESAS